LTLSVPILPSSSLVLPKAGYEPMSIKFNGHNDDYVFSYNSWSLTFTNKSIQCDLLTNRSRI